MNGPFVNGGLNIHQLSGVNMANSSTNFYHPHTTADKIKYEKYFMDLVPQNGTINGVVAKQFFLKSGLPTLVLANIWDLADMNKDGLLDKNEFCAAMQLITMKLAGQTLPQPPINLVYNNSSNLTPKINAISFNSQNNCNIKLDLDNYEWGIPMPTRIRYHQIFSKHDVYNTGHISGLQAKDLFLQTQLPQHILAQIWNVSDIDVDGNLDLEEFCLAFYLVEEYRAGRLHKIPDVLPQDLVPPKCRKSPLSSITNISTLKGNANKPNSTSNNNINIQNVNGEISEEGATNTPTKMLPTFEDRRRENFDKGAAILEQKREQLLRAETEERARRQRKEEQELEAKRLLKLEQEKKKQEEYEKLLAKQKESERANDMEKIKLYQSKELARKELEKQLKQDMVDRRIKDLTSCINWEKEVLSGLKTKEKDLDCDIQNMEEKISNMHQTLKETKNTALKLKDNKAELFTQNQDVEGTVNTLEAQYQMLEAKLLHLNKEKGRAKEALTAFGYGSRDNLLDDQKTGHSNSSHVNINFTNFNSNNDKFNKNVASPADKDKKRTDLLSSITDLQKHLAFNAASNKTNDINISTNNKGFITSDNTFGQIDLFGDNFGNQPDAFANNATTNIPSVLHISKTVKNTLESCMQSPIRSPPSLKTATSPIKSPLISSLMNSPPSMHGDVYKLASGMEKSLRINETHKDNILTNQQENKAEAKLYPYKAIYPFEARSDDELSFKVGDIILVAESEQSEEGWLGGKLGTKVGWFPSSYAVKITAPYSSDNISSLVSDATTSEIQAATPRRALAIFSLTAETPGDLSFQKGDIIAIESELDVNWWIGSLHGDKGYVPKSYVKVIGSDDSNEASSNYKLPTSVSSGDRPLSTPLDLFNTSTTSHYNNNSNETQIDSNLDGRGDSHWPSWKSESGYVENTKTYTSDPFATTPSPFKTTFNPKAFTELKNDNTPHKDAGFGSDVFTTTKDTILSSADKYTAVYTFTSQEPGDLDLQVGDTVEIDPSQNLTEDWWKGKNVRTGKKGIFPNNYVKKLDSPTPNLSDLQYSAQRSQSITSNKSANNTSTNTNSLQSVYIAIAPFTATGPEQISLMPGTLLKVRRKTPAGWWEGEIMNAENSGTVKKQIGWFPGSHVKPSKAHESQRVSLRGASISSLGDGLTQILPSYPDKSPGGGGNSINSQSDPFSNSVSNNTNKTIINTSPIKNPHDILQKPVTYVVRALFDYTSNHEGDLNFAKGDTIHVTSKNDAHWWTGTNVSRPGKPTGIFPSNYVAGVSIQ